MLTVARRWMTSIKDPMTTKYLINSPIALLSMPIEFLAGTNYLQSSSCLCGYYREHIYSSMFVHFICSLIDRPIAY
jgi:hypothetical protein